MSRPPYIFVSSVGREDGATRRVVPLVTLEQATRACKGNPGLYSEMPTHVFNEGIERVVLRKHCLDSQP